MRLFAVIFIGCVFSVSGANASSQYCRVSAGLPILRLNHWIETHTTEVGQFAQLTSRLKEWKAGDHHFYSNPEHESRLAQLQIRELLKKTGILLTWGKVQVVDLARASAVYNHAAKDRTIVSSLPSFEEFSEDLQWVLLARNTDITKLSVRRHFLSEEIHERVASALRTKLNAEFFDTDDFSIRNPKVMDAELEFSVLSKALVTEYSQQLETMKSVLRFFPYQNIAPKPYRKWAKEAFLVIKAEYDVLKNHLLLNRAIQKDRGTKVSYMDMSLQEYQLEQLIP
jgi:hypothetical protein